MVKSRLETLAAAVALVLILYFLLSVRPVHAEDHLVANPSFDADLSHWSPFNATSQLVRDESRFYSAPASLKIPVTAERNAAKQTNPIVMPAGTTEVLASYRGYRADASNSGALVTGQLKITFHEDESVATHYPAEFRISPGEANQWVEKSTVYRAPPGLTIESVQVFLINNGVNVPGYDQPAWFDDVQVQIGQGMPEQPEQLPNPSFDTGIEHWAPFNGTTVLEWDSLQGHHAPGSLKILHTGERNAARQVEPLAMPEGVTQLIARYSGYRLDEIHNALVTAQLKVEFNEGGTATHYPPEFRLSAAESGEWIPKVTLYTAPEGKTIKSAELLLLNYGVNLPNYNSPAWFDDLAIEIYQQPDVPTGVGLLTPPDSDSDGLARFNQVKAFLEQHDVAFDVIDQYTPWEGTLQTVIIPAWHDDLSRKVRDFWYLDGKVVLFDVPDTVRADLMMWYVFAYDPDLPPPASAVVSGEGRAAALTVAELAAQPAASLALIEDVIAQEAVYPSIPADPYANQPVYALQDGILTVDGEPFYMHGPGFYNVGYFGGRTETRDYDAELPQLKEQGHNVVVGYVDLNDDKSEMVKFLDSVEQAGMKAVLWFRDDTAYSLLTEANAAQPGSETIPMPWQDRYMEKVLQLREHPALLGYLIADDAQREYLPWIERMSAFIKHYDQRNLVAATMLTLRSPGSVIPEEWDRWKQVLDIPITYIYPMHNYAPGIPVIGGAQGYDNIAALADNVRSVWGDEVYFVLWSQAHMQGPVYDSFGLALNDPVNHPFIQETIQPFADQQRLILYRTAMAGAKGNFLFTYQTGFRDESLAAGRRNEIRAVRAELSPFDAMILAGERRTESTGTADLKAVSYADGGAKVILIAQSVPESETGYTEGRIHEDVTLTVEAPDVQHVYQVTADTVVQLPVTAEDGMITFTLEPFDTTSIVYMSTDAGQLSAWTGYYDAIREQRLRWRYNAVLDTRSKTEVYAEKIEESVALPSGIASSFLAAANKMAEARCIALQDAVPPEDLAHAHDLLTEANQLYLIIQKELILQARQYAAQLPATNLIQRQTGTLIGLPSFYFENMQGAPIGLWEMGDRVLARMELNGGTIEHPPDSQHDD